MKNIKALILKSLRNFISCSHALYFRENLKKQHNLKHSFNTVPFVVCFT